MTRLLRASGCVALFAGLGCVGPAEPPPIPDRAPDKPEVVIQAVRLPGGGTNPRAVLRHGVLHVVSFAGPAAGGDVHYVRSTDGGMTFSQPVRVNRAPAVLAGAGHGPQLAVDEEGLAHVAWAGAASVCYSRAVTPGAFAAPRDLGPAPGATAVAAGCNGVLVFWHAAPAGGPRRVWVAESLDKGVTFSEPAAASPATHDVGPASALSALLIYPAMPVVVCRAARDDWGQHLLFRKHAGSDFEAVRLGGGEAEACPAAVTDVANNYLVAWEARGQIHFARARHQTGTFGPTVTSPGPGGSRRYPALAHDGARTALAWVEPSAAGRASVRWQLYDHEDRPLSRGGVVEDVGGGPFALVAQGGRFLLIH